jgi:7,8-dihydropterin-6-yl-methyl-4-(beta-D-ribofuranosyl)aminobenzene 5'-phosphate synthase
MRPAHTFDATTQWRPYAGPTASFDVPAQPGIAMPTLDVGIAPQVTLKVLYDNRPYDRRLRTAWGFACLVVTPRLTVLFDTGADGPTLLHNMQALRVEASKINAVVLSHFHTDHIGGLNALLSINPALTVYMPRRFPETFKSLVRKSVRLVEVSGPLRIAEGISLSGELGQAIIEEALLIESHHGRVMITGCAHPGIAEMVRAMRQSGSVSMLVGGCHLLEKSEREITHIISELKTLGVQTVAPSHCTGDVAIKLLKMEFGPGFVTSGAGATIALAP